MRGSDPFHFVSGSTRQPGENARMSEQWCHAHVIEAALETLLSRLAEAALPIGVRVARAPYGIMLLFEGLAPEVGLFLSGLPWPVWVETHDGISDSYRLTLLRNGQQEYEESLDGDGRAWVTCAKRRRHCDAARISVSFASLADAGLSELERSGVRLLPGRHLWQGEPFPWPATAEIIATLPPSRPAEPEGEMPV